jgi:ribosomal protein L37E
MTAVTDFDESSIPDQEWWNSLREGVREYIITQLKYAWKYYKHGDARIDGHAFCPRCGSPNYAMKRMGGSQLRSDEPHYYGKYCWSCGYQFDPRAEV